MTTTTPGQYRAAALRSLATYGYGIVEVPGADGDTTPRRAVQIDGQTVAFLSVPRHAAGAAPVTLIGATGFQFGPNVTYDAARPGFAKTVHGDISRMVQLQDDIVIGAMFG